jgi:hypothetical protein
MELAPVLTCSSQSSAIRPSRDRTASRDDDDLAVRRHQMSGLDRRRGHHRTVVAHR